MPEQARPPACTKQQLSLVHLLRTLRLRCSLFLPASLPFLPPVSHTPFPTRCLQNGGSLAYLHGGKPFIRGGDFTARQQLGDRPMQLNYSRAFGG